MDVLIALNKAKEEKPTYKAIKRLHCLFKAINLISFFFPQPKK